MPDWFYLRHSIDFAFEWGQILLGRTFRWFYDQFGAIYLENR